MTKRDLSVLTDGEVYQLLEPGPVVMVTTFGNERSNIMTMSWHILHQRLKCQGSV